MIIATLFRVFATSTSASAGNGKNDKYKAAIIGPFKSLKEATVQKKELIWTDAASRFTYRSGERAPEEGFVEALKAMSGEAKARVETALRGRRDVISNSGILFTNEVSMN
jgi:hypothetical protein